MNMVMSVLLRFLYPPSPSLFITTMSVISAASLANVASFGIFPNEGFSFLLVNSALTIHFFKRIFEVGQLREVSNKANNAELKLFLEVESGQDLRPIPPPVKSKEEILLFFKLYDPLKEELRYVGRLFVKSNGKPAEILTKLNELASVDVPERPGREIPLCSFGLTTVQDSMSRSCI